MDKYLKKLPFYNHPWFNFVRFLVRHFFEDDCQQKAASLTYTTLLSLVPILTVLLMILSTVPALESVRDQISQLIYSNLLPQSTSQVSQYLNDFADKSSNLTAIGAMVLFVTTIMTLTTIERAFNKIWRVDDRSGGIKSILRYWTIITVGPLVLGTAFIVSGAIQSISFLNRDVAGYFIDWAFWLQIFSYGITVAGFIGMYWFIPKAKVPIKNAAIAGLITAILFELLKTSFGSIMANFTSYEAIYGAFAALPIFLLWLYLSWNLILLGVEISYTLTIFATREVYPRHPLLSLLDMLNMIHDRHEVGETVSEQELRNVLGRKELPKWYTYINYLKDSNLITITEEDKYVLKRDLNNMTLWDFYKTLPYPLPIKDELDNMDRSAMKPWLSELINRFITTENHAKSQLNVPLSTIFAHSHPRAAQQNPHPIVNNNTFDKNGRYSGDYTPETFDPSANVTKDNDNREIIIPDESSDSPTYPRRGDTTSMNKYQSKSKTQNSTSHTIQPSKPSKKGGVFGFLGNSDAPIITEDDNPNKQD